MITLITGTPGAGKTLFAVKKLVEEILPEARKTGRTIYTNINGLAVSDDLVKECDLETPFKWQDYPDGSVFIFDEVQRQYPPRFSGSKVPDYIAAYQTHRHRGMDFYFVTQGPKLLDSHFDALIEHHYHLHRSFGMKRATIRHWEAVNKEPQPPQSDFNALKNSFYFPKRYFDLYKSASVHTVKPRLPWKMITILTVGSLFVVGCFIKLASFASKYQDENYTAELVHYDGYEGDPNYRFVPATALALPECAARSLGWMSGVLVLKAGAALVSVPPERVQVFPGAFVIALDNGACRL